MDNVHLLQHELGLQHYQVIPHQPHLISPYLVLSSHLPLLTNLVLNPKLESHCSLLLGISTAAEQVEAEHYWVGQSLTTPTNPEPDGQVPHCADSIQVDFKYF